MKLYDGWETVAKLTLGTQAEKYHAYSFYQTNILLIEKINKKSLAEQGYFMCFRILWCDFMCLLIAKKDWKTETRS